ncbi:hypothetical protein E3N88_33367 [Mikania micrantha]|uniref:G-patch domain-containing protein n=1 Tax=Mikania micrantha TaxID=192012 RepID=A0A5N6MBS1_9ASTR|nr:hypothetical protein E3N88_33367 [Mikania micrantha]
MLGGLYGDLPPPSSTSTDEDAHTKTPNPSSNVWSSSVKMAPPTLRKPSNSSHIPPPKALIKPQQAKSRTPTITPVADVTTRSSSFQPALVGVTSSVVEEYDPARPNDYEEYKRERKRKAAEAELKREIERRRQEEEEREKRDREVKEKEREKDFNISGEDAWKRRAAMSQRRSHSPPAGDGDDDGDGFSIEKSETGGLGVGAGGQMTAAQRMMAKMGWKAGQGLGKQEQGITTPLMAKKTDRRAGVIVNASEAKQQAEKKTRGVSINGQPTRVVLLRNMVGPGEVDDDLEAEVAEECSKYGTVTRVLIFEITEPGFPVDEAVRIFVQFERSEQATKALVDLEGRFFGGRVVRATFYDEERFNTNQLAPMTGEIPGFI